MEHWTDSEDEDTGSGQEYPDNEQLQETSASERSRRHRRQLYDDEASRDYSNPFGTSQLQKSESLNYQWDERAEASTRHHVDQFASMPVTSCDADQSYQGSPASSRKRFSSKRHSKSCPDFHDAQRIVEELYKNYTNCRRCSGSDIHEVTDRDGKILLLECASCLEPFGFDDLNSEHLLVHLYKQDALQIQVGCCANTDPNKFQIVGFDGANFSVCCEVCKQISPLSNLSPEQEAEEIPQTESPDEDFFKCSCGNQDQGQMILSLGDDDSRSVQCARCSEIVYDENPTLQVIQTRRHRELDEELQGMRMSGATSQQTSGPLQLLGYQLPLQSSPDEKGATCDPSGGKEVISGKKLASHAVNYREITKFRELQRGDHIKWDRNAGYSHHAIVEHLLEPQSHIQILHYNGPDSTGFVAREEVDPFKNPQERLFIAEYEQCFDVEEVIRRAKSRLGETQYNLALNNCEHFATWCKTGHHVSSQVVSVKACFMKYAKVCSSGLRTADLRNLGKNPPRALGPKAYVMQMASTEIRSCMRDVTKAADDLKKGHLTKDAYLEVVVSRAAKSIGGMAGMALGVMVPIPVVGEFIGGTVGGMIGEFAGKQVGKVVVRASDSYRYLFKGAQLQIQQ